MSRQFSQNSPYQFSPNVGIAYDLTGKGNTVIRAGAEFIYDEANWFTNERTTQNPPFATSVAQAPTSTSGPLSFANPWAAGTTVGDPFPLPDNASPATAVFPLQADYEVLPDHFKPASTMQWTLSVQQKLGRGWQLRTRLHRKQDQPHRARSGAQPSHLRLRASGERVEQDALV